MKKLYVTLKNFDNEHLFQSALEVDYKIPKYEILFEDYGHWILDGGKLYLSKNLKFAYVYYYGDTYKYKVKNIQSKPSKDDKIRFAIFGYKELIKEEEKIRKLKSKTFNDIIKKKKGVL